MPDQPGKPVSDADTTAPAIVKPPFNAYVAIGVGIVVVVAVTLVGIQHHNATSQANGPVTYAVGSGSTSMIGGIPVAPPSEPFLRYSDPAHRQRKFGEDGMTRSSLAATLVDSDNSHAAQVAKEQRDAAVAAAKADAATAAAGAAAAKQAALSSAQSSTNGQAPVANFNPVGRWVRQDGANDYQFFRSDGIWYESDGTESTAAADTFPESAHWQLDTEGDSTYITTGADRFSVIGADTIRGDKSGTYIRVGE